MPIKIENRGLYHPDWKIISWAVRFFRANGQCEWIDQETGQRCDRRDQEPIPGKPERMTVLTVMHLDHKPEHNDLTNLLAACQAHHLTYDAMHHATNAAETRRKKKAEFYDGDIFSLDEAAGETSNA